MVAWKIIQIRNILSIEMSCQIGVNDSIPFTYIAIILFNSLQKHSSARVTISLVLLHVFLWFLGNVYLFKSFLFYIYSNQNNICDLVQIDCRSVIIHIYMLQCPSSKSSPDTTGTVYSEILNILISLLPRPLSLNLPSYHSWKYILLSQNKIE